MKGKAHAYAWVFPFIVWKLRESNGPLRKTSGGRFLGPGVIASEPRQKAATVRSDSPYVGDGGLCERSDWRRVCTWCENLYGSLFFVGRDLPE